MQKHCFIIILLIFLCFAGCGNTDLRSSSDTGAVAFSVAWQDARTLAPGAPSAVQFAPLDCAATGVSTVSALAYSASNGFLASGGPWNCSDHSGTISNIPAQSNVKIVVLARDASGNAIYRGEQQGVTIAAGQTTNAGTIMATLFPPSLTAPANGSTVPNGSSFSWTSTGVSYEIQASDNNAFTSTVIDATGTATLYTPEISLNAGTYYWRVKSLDTYGNTSAWSGVWSFDITTVLPPPPAPVGVAASPGINQNTISWNPVTGATAYNIYWSLSSNVTTTTGTKIPGVTNPYTHTPLTNLTTYYYIVTAVNTDGESAASAVVSAVPGSNLWIWTSGSNTFNQSGSYGFIRTPSSTNIPGARYGAVSWIDSSNNLWLFGGNSSTNSLPSYFNDLWKFDGTNWTWMSGAKTTNQSGTYGTKGAAAPSNVPGARYGAVSWIDSNNNLWVFGGQGYDSTSVRGPLNDLWKFDGTNWAWVSGATTTNQSGTYGTKGAAAPSNVPGARYGAVSWIDSNNNLWLFGGLGCDSAGATGYLNDLWKFDGTNWAWVGGATTTNQSGTYGTKGAAAPSNVPGARTEAVSWIDSNNNLWLFGGLGRDAAGVLGPLNDLWKFDGSNWTWVSGSNTASQLGTYGTLGVPAATNVPGARAGSVSWIDSNNFLWLFGGTGTGGGYAYLNDLWKFDGTNWTWVAGSNSGNQTGNYGSLGVPAPSNVPGARQQSVFWRDSNGTLWIFGGMEYISPIATGLRNDLWVYHPWP